MALRADMIDAVDLEAIRAARDVDMIDDAVRAVRVAEGYHDGRALMPPGSLSDRSLAGAVRVRTTTMEVEEELEAGDALNAVKAAQRAVLDVVVLLLRSRVREPFSRDQFEALAEAAYGPFWSREVHAMTWLAMRKQLRPPPELAWLPR